MPKEVGVSMGDFRAICVSVDERIIAVNSWSQGAGPIILFVHGWMHSTSIWQKVFDRLPSNYSLVAIDLPGFGKSAPLNKGSRTMAHYASVVRGVVEALSTEGAMRLLVADSLGAIAVLHLMRTVLIPTQALLLSGCPVDGLPARLSILKATGVVKYTLKALRVLPVAISHRIIKNGSYMTLNSVQSFEPLLADSALAADPNTAESLIKELFIPFPPGTSVINHGIESSIIRGRDDEVVPEASARRLAELLRGELVEIHNSGHTPMMENPDAYSEAILSILQRTKGGKVA